MERYLVASLGNPSPEYDGTRHNIGHQCVAAWHLAIGGRTRVNVPRIPAGVFTSARFANVIIANDCGNFMNESGRPIATIVQHYKIPPTNLILVHDELALPLGRLRLDRNISAAGHNGVESVIDALGTQNFMRLRLGIESRPDHRLPSEAFVLQKFSKEEEPTVTAMVTRAAEALTAIFVNGLERAMTEYNQFANANG